MASFDRPTRKPRSTASGYHTLARCLPTSIVGVSPRLENIGFIARTASTSSTHRMATTGGSGLHACTQHATCNEEKQPRRTINIQYTPGIRRYWRTVPKVSQESQNESHKTKHLHKQRQLKLTARTATLVIGAGGGGVVCATAVTDGSPVQQVTYNKTFFFFFMVSGVTHGMYDATKQPRASGLTGIVYREEGTGPPLVSM